MTRWPWAPPSTLTSVSGSGQRPPPVGPTSTGLSAESTRRSPVSRAAGSCDAAGPARLAGSGMRWQVAPGLKPGWRPPAWRKRRNARAAVLSRRRSCTAGGVAPALDVARHQSQVGELALKGARCDYQPRCLWQNGLLPSAATAVPASEPMRRGEGVARGPLPGLGGSVVEAWADGSALHPGVRQLCRAGWGLWIPGVEGGELA